MAMVVVLFPVSDEEPKVEAAALEELSRLGITSITLLRDQTHAGLVFEGWTFDLRDSHGAARAVAGAGEGIRVLQPLVQMAVTPRAALLSDRSE